MELLRKQLLHKPPFLRQKVSNSICKGAFFTPYQQFQLGSNTIEEKSLTVLFVLDF